MTMREPVNLLRRQALKDALAFGIGLPLSGGLLSACVNFRKSDRVSDVTSARNAIERLLPEHVQQIRLQLLARDGVGDRFEIGGDAGHIVLRGTSLAALLAALNHYLKYTANAHVSWAGSQLNLPATLPAPATPVSMQTNLTYRFAINDTDDGYSGPYRNWRDWERTIDVLALHGCNSALVTVGQEAVYHRVLQEFGYHDAEVRAWIPAPAHQPWWLLQNMSGFGGPVSTQLLEKRIELGRRIAGRMRELGIVPVFPGYFGTVPDGFVERNPQARIIDQGKWVGFDRPDWLDPTSPPFSRVAASFYRHQEALFGKTSMFKMDLLHEGGKSGNINVSDAAREVQAALDRAHPGAIWVTLGWQKNPPSAVLAGVNRTRMLIVDGLSDRYAPPPDRDKDWNGTPYAFGSIPNFGGHTTLGAKADAWNRRYFALHGKPHGALCGTAYMPEGIYRDPAAFEYFSELAWRDAPPELGDWFARYATYRYGGSDLHASAAWQALAASLFRLRTDEYSEPPDSLLAARPSLDVATAASWSPEKQLYDPKRVEAALHNLLMVAPELRESDAYRYDLVDVARQCLANRARARLPQIHAAFDKRDLAGFRKLTTQWLDEMRLSEQLLATHPGFMVGPWLARARASGEDDAEQARLEFDARSILTTWGTRKSANDNGLHDYANREWAGLMAGLYLPRWRHFFDGLEAALQSGTAMPEAVDWYAMEDAWARARGIYPTEPVGSSEVLAKQVFRLCATDT